MEAEIEEFNVEQQEAEATAPPSPLNTKNDVEVDIIRRIQVGILDINTVTLKTETTNEFKKQIC